MVDRERKNAERTLAAIEEEGSEASVFVADVTSNSQCQDMAQAAVARYGTLNVLVNNVGINGPGSVTDVDEDFWDTVIDVNLKSVMLTSKHAIPRMTEAGGGSIINISSIVGLRAGGGRPSHPYAASKGGMIGLSNSMAVTMGATTSGSIASPPGMCTARSWPDTQLRRCEIYGAGPDPWAPRAPPGTWRGRRCSWLATRPAGFREQPCRWTPGC